MYKKMPEKLRYMEASREGPCRYCTHTIYPGQQIAGHYGILWGHDLCVQDAFTVSRLILSPNNKERRPEELLNRANRMYARNKVLDLPWSPDFQELKKEYSLEEHQEFMRQKIAARIGVPKEPLGEAPSGRSIVMGTRTGRWRSDGVNVNNPPKSDIQPAAQSETGSTHSPRADITPEEKQDLADSMVKSGRMNAPECDCKHFKPIFICRHKIPYSMRPSKKMLEGDGTVMNAPSIEEIAWRLKEEEYERRFQEYKKGKREMPTCPVHIHMKVVTLSVRDKSGFYSKWESDLWLVCAHEGEDKPQSTYRGYELI
jgi:hypothetical protein